MFSPVRVLRSTLPSATRTHPICRAYTALFSDSAPLSGKSNSPDLNKRTSDFVPIQTKPVEDAPESILSSPAAFLDYIRSPDAAPLIFRNTRERDVHDRSRAQEFMQSLRASGNRLVEVEAGRDVEVDQGLHLPHDFRTSIALDTYLDWLCGGQKGLPNAPWYLAQWSARDEVPGLVDVVRPPPLLAPLLDENKADMYQTGFFVGPASAMSRLHFDPYENLYTLHAASEASLHAKHWLLLPASLGRLLAPRLDPRMQPNMSTLDFRISRRKGDEGNFDVLVNRASVPKDAVQYVLDANNALSCLMREGDMLFVPRRWWHRVENVILKDDRDSTQERHSEKHAGWTVGIGWWFLSRAP